MGKRLCVCARARTHGSNLGVDAPDDERALRHLPGQAQPCGALLRLGPGRGRPADHAHHTRGLRVAVCACVCARASARVRSRMRPWQHTSQDGCYTARACVMRRLRACVHIHMRACIFICVRAYSYACVHIHMRAGAYVGLRVGTAALPGPVVYVCIPDAGPSSNQGHAGHSSKLVVRVPIHACTVSVRRSLAATDDLDDESVCGRTLLSHWTTLVTRGSSAGGRVCRPQQTSLMLVPGAGLLKRMSAR